MHTVCVAHSIGCNTPMERVPGSPHLQNPVPLGAKGAVAVARESAEKDPAESESVEWDVLQWQ